LPGIAMEIRIPTRKTILLLSLVTLGIVIVNAICQYQRFRMSYQVSVFEIITVNGDTNFPTWFSSILLLLSSVLLLVNGLAVRSRRGLGAHYWFVLAAGFLAMSIDEVAAVHERSDRVVNRLMGYSQLPTYQWVVIGWLVAIAAGVYFLRFLAMLPAGTRWRFIIAGAVYVGGALGMESFNGYYEKRFGYDWTFENLTLLEETMEMAGVIVLIGALLKHLERQVPQVLMRVGDAPSREGKTYVAEPSIAGRPEPARELVGSE
jgi:hypothetical protein